MQVLGKPYRTIWRSQEDPNIVQIIDQRHLPHRFVVEDLRTVDEVAIAIRDMHVRGAGLIGATAGYGMYLAALEASSAGSPQAFLEALEESGEKLIATRPTAVNLEWAVKRQLDVAQKAHSDLFGLVQLARETADTIADEDADFCRRIGQHGLPLLREIAERKNGEAVNVLTHCNAGWLAFVDYGTATSPIYAAHDAGIPVHVWVDETRPRNQGAGLTAWELGQHGVPHTVIVDNAGGYLMQQGLVDFVITGTDRTTFTGDVANKIGTYLKALAAKDNGIPFYVALPSSTFDWEMEDGVHEIPIEQRDSSEVKYVIGSRDGEVMEVLITPEDSPAGNYAFDVTPRRLVTGLITERGICGAAADEVLRLFPEKRR
ncbi:MAG: S-methyl-5-thioribose-1-phosphate isomerase [Acidobacteriota bacterium]|nr:MAG: S-methyl-5-thioribose-1-phosphate isomerase [Acidobacteriota bacterium]